MIRVLFFGTPDFSLPTLQALLASDRFTVAGVVTQPDRPAGRGGKLRASPVKELAVAHSLPVFQPASIRKNLDQFLSDISPFLPLDVAVVIAFGQILPLPVLSLPRAGSVNIHASLLPRWRGAAPIARAVMAGDRASGVALMKMEEGLDTGPVYSSSSIKLEPHETGGSLHDKLAVLGAELLTRDLESIVSGAIAPQAQPTEGVTYAAKISNDEARLCWSQSSVQIERVVRALSPFPGAFTFMSGQRLKILNATAQPGDAAPSSDTAPGTIALIATDRLEIRCGSGTLNLHEVQLEGKKRLSIREFLRGTTIATSTRFE